MPSGIPRPGNTSLLWPFTPYRLSSWFLPRIVKLANECLDGLLPVSAPLAIEHVFYQCQKGQSSNAFCSPIRADSGARDTPNFFGVAFEEHFEKPAAETIGNPRSQIGLRPLGENMGSQETQAAHQNFEWSQTADHVCRIKWIIEEPGAIVDPRQPRAAQKIGPQTSRHMLSINAILV